MCGILGLVAPVGRVPGVSRAEAVAMRDAMTARGPDGAGLFEHRNVLFAHRRLAIRDLAGGAQPWISEDGQTVLVYNGEVYNDTALRDELTQRGHRFRSRCDTEVVLEAWRAWGPACVERFVGMFAFGIYDFRDDTLFLARDPCGVKPLFFADVKGCLAFASSIPALLRHPNVPREPYWPAISHYLTTFRITLGRETVYNGIRQLLPGERLLVRNGRISVDRYWQPPIAEIDDVTDEEAADRVEAHLRQAVTSQLASDVPVGMFLSGGVDSSTIACLVHEQVGPSMQAKCGGDSAGSSPDFEFARACAAHVGFDYGEVHLGPDEYLATWGRLIEDYATPVSTPTDAIIFRLSQEMKRSVGVVLGGEGADEALCGYGVQHWCARDFELSQRRGTRNWPGDNASSQRFGQSLVNQYGRETFFSEVDHYFALNSLIPSAVKPALLQPKAWRAAGEDESMISLYAELLRAPAGETLQRRHFHLLHRVNLESLLSRLDTATMQAGLEARVPFTDHRFVEAAFRLPQRLRIDIDPAEATPHLSAAELDLRGSLRTKRVLRTVAGRLMPAELANRRKASFPTPVATWLQGPWRDRVRAQLLDSPFGREHFRPEAMRELAGNPAAAGMWLWPLLNVLAWGDRFFGAAHRRDAESVFPPAATGAATVERRAG